MADPHVSLFATTSAKIRPVPDGAWLLTRQATGKDAITLIICPVLFVPGAQDQKQKRRKDTLRDLSVFLNEHLE